MYFEQFISVTIQCSAAWYCVTSTCMYICSKSRCWFRNGAQPLNYSVNMKYACIEKAHVIRSNCRFVRIRTKLRLFLDLVTYAMCIKGHDLRSLRLFRIGIPMYMHSLLVQLYRWGKLKHTVHSSATGRPTVQQCASVSDNDTVVQLYIFEYSRHKLMHYSNFL